PSPVHVATILKLLWATHRQQRLSPPSGAANGQDSWGFFRDAQGFGRLDVGSRTGLTSSRPPSTTMDLGI
ncbi:unnamed protein product, partial [Ascophyllum nodosum]